MPTRMRGSRMGFVWVTEVKPFGECRAGCSSAGGCGWGCCGWGCGCGFGGGGGVVLQATATQTRSGTAKCLMKRMLCKNAGQPADAFRNPLVRLLGEGQAHGVCAAAVDKEWTARDEGDAARDGLRDIRCRVHRRA